MKIISRVFFIASFVGVALAGEWNCADTSGTFELSTDCTMTDEVDVSGDLTVTGNETLYSTLTAANGKRHFKITSGAHKLSLKWLNMTGGDLCNTWNDDACHGGSIRVHNVAAHLNISHSVFFNNRAGSGGAVSAKNGQPNLFVSFVLFDRNTAIGYGGAVYLEKGTFQGEMNTFNNNIAGLPGGAMFISSSSVSSFHTSFLQNTAVSGGGGIYVYGSSSSPSQLNLTRGLVEENKQTNGGGYGDYGGGGLSFSKKVTANIRECTFVRNEATENTGGNKHGHQIMTRKDSSEIPSIAIVNTNFTDLAGDHPFYGYVDTPATHGADKYVSPTTCASSPCSVSPFTGTCTARTNTKGGVLCGVTGCPTGEFRISPEVTESLLPPPSPPSCSAWSSCMAGEYVSSNGTNTTDRVCTPCGAGAYSASDNEDSCTPWTNCTAGYRISANGTSTSNRVCSSCTVGKYSADANEGSCTAWTTCIAGQKIAANGTATTDRTCEACPSGQFSAATNQNACTNWTTCNATTEVESSAGSTTADRVCAAAESPSPAGSPSPAPAGSSPSPAGSSPSPAANASTTDVPNELSAASRSGPSIYLYGVLMASTWFGMERRLRLSMLRLFLFASFVGVALAGEWNCADTSGTFTQSTDCTVSSQVVVTGSLNITGVPDANGVLPKIIGGGSNRLFKVQSGGELLVKYLNLTGGVINSGADEVQKSGGAILLEGSTSILIVSDSIFHGNQAVERGGAIYANTNSRSVISNCKFISNYISGGTCGGAVNFKEAFSNLTNNEFVFNKVQGSHGGSAISAWSYQKSSEIQILKSNFTHNTFQPSITIKHGAAIALYYCKTLYGCKLVIKDSHFVGNVVSSETTGAAMYVYASDLMVSNSFIFQPYVFVIVQQGSDTEVQRGGWLSVVNSTIDTGTSAWKIVKSETTGSPSYTRLVFVNIRMISSNNGILIDAISPVSCTSAPAQCADNGYINHICIDQSNPDEGVICAQNCSTGYQKTGTFNHTCAACPSGTYNTLWNQHKCLLWSDCSAGQYIATNGTSSADRVCSSCTAGTYSTTLNAFSCTARTTCVAGQKIAANGTSSTDRTCEACPTGKFSTASNQNACTNWTACNATTEVESSAGSATADRVCATAESPSPSGDSPSPSDDSPSPSDDSPSPSGDSPSPSGNSPSPAGSPSPSPAENSPSPAANTSTTDVPNELSAAHRYQPQLYLCGVLMVSMFFLGI